MTRYAPADRDLASLEAEARAAKRGLWSQPGAVRPWDWRSGKGVPVMAEVVGNRQSHLYHAPNCRGAAATSEKNQVAFASRGEAWLPAGWGLQVKGGEMLHYHTTYGEFSGEAAAEIVGQLYDDIRHGIGLDLTKQKWWAYQRTAWKLCERKKLPASLDQTGVPEAFIACMVEVEALQVGPRLG